MVWHSTVGLDSLLKKVQGMWGNSIIAAPSVTGKSNPCWRCHTGPYPR